MRGTPSGQGHRRVSLGEPANLGSHPWSLDQAMNNNMGLEEINKRSNSVKRFDWMLDYSIGHDPLVYKEGMVLSQQESLPRCNFQVFHMSKFGSESKGQIRTWSFFSLYHKLQRLSDLRNIGTSYMGMTRGSQASFSRFLGSSDVPTLATSYMGRNFWRWSIFPRT
jgi:hypothetical protein